MLIELSADGRTYERLAEASEYFHGHWETVSSILEEAGAALTQQEIRRRWPYTQS
ncbi:MAG: hypothetical protein L0Z53_28655 [Acidobacteriales bacterium]|nr:hypothetical protein [Terriglobales bacterium]